MSFTALKITKMDKYTRLSQPKLNSYIDLQMILNESFLCILLSVLCQKLFWKLLQLYTGSSKIPGHAYRQDWCTYHSMQYYLRWNLTSYNFSWFNHLLMCLNHDFPFFLSWPLHSCLAIQWLSPYIWIWLNPHLL